MSWKDKLKEAQGGESGYPDFLKQVSTRLEIKGNAKGDPAFTYYDREAEEKKYSTKAIDGVLIGSAMKLYAFDNSIGKKGGTITSSVFFKFSDNAVAFSEGNTTFRGTAENIRESIRNQAGKCKTLRVYYILNKNGLYEITTNISFSIFEIGRLEPGTFSGYTANLVPKEYDPEDKQFDKRFQDLLGPFASKNRPKYASISVGEEITDTIAEEINLETIIDKFDEFKKFTSNEGTTEGVVDGAERSEADYPEVEIGEHTLNDAPSEQTHESDDEPSDLPW